MHSLHDDLAVSEERVADWTAVVGSKTVNSASKEDAESIMVEVGSGE